jgi:hypothetical protein
MPCLKARGELLLIERSTKQMSFDREVLPDQAEARQESLSAIGIAEASHAPLAFTRGLMTIFGPVVYPGTGLDEDVFDGGELGYFGLRWGATMVSSGRDVCR